MTARGDNPCKSLTFKSKFPFLYYLLTDIKLKNGSQI